MRFSLPSINARLLLLGSDYCRARGNQIVEHSSDNMADMLEVLGSSRKLGGAAEHAFEGSDKRILSVEL